LIYSCNARYATTSHKSTGKDSNPLMGTTGYSAMKAAVTATTEDNQVTPHPNL